MELATSCLESGDGDAFIQLPSDQSPSPVHKMLEVQSLYKPSAPSHQPSAKRRRLRLTSVPLVDLRVPPSEGTGDCSDFYGSLNSPPRSLTSDIDATSISNKSGICSVSESMDTPKSGASSIRIKHLTSSWESESRFPKLNECAHFHYEFVELGPINVCIFDEAQENSKLLANGAVERRSNFAVQVSSNGKSWVVRRSYENFRMLDQQLHQCIYDRKFSALQEIPKEYHDHQQVNSKEGIITVFSEYLQRFSDIAGNLINCGPILNWLELDNRGNRLIVTDDSAINTPAVAAAYVTKRYISQATDEISFEVGDMISVIDMPPPDESIWWRGKRGFEVGFFPSECVEVIGDKVPHSIHIPKAPTKPVLRKHGKLIAFFRSFILSRPSRRKLKQSGILKERVFGCDLGEHLLNSGHEIPMVLKCCSDFIEAHGIVDGIYRLSGVTSNIQKLRNTFDEERVPDLKDEAILHDIHCVASLLKMYFRELPNPLLTYQLYDKFVSAVQSEDDVRLLNVRDVVQQLPPPHYRTLEYLVRHLSRVAAHGTETGMTPKNVAIVWAPNLLRSKDLEIGGVAALQVVGVQAVVTEFLIHYSDLIFNDKMPAFSPCLELTGTPKRNRPKSLAISTPTKLLSLEEARSRALGAIQFSQKYIEVGGGPSMLPNKYHTVIELPDRKRGSSKHKKSPSGWKSFFSKGKSTHQSTRERDKSKSRRKGSSTPSDPGIPISLTDKAVTEPDISRNNNRLRSVKSAESLISSATSSQRNSDAIDNANGSIDVTGSEDLLSSSLGAVSSTQLRQSPHSHIRSISHDSYFEFSFDRQHRDEKRIGELATITSEDNDEEEEKIMLDDFIRLHYVDQTSESSVTYQTDEQVTSTLNDVTIGTSLTDKLTSSSTPVYALINDNAVDDSEDTLNKFGTETLQEQSSIDSDDDHSDIVGDIQQEVAAALHWDEPSYPGVPISPAPDVVTSSASTPIVQIFKDKIDCEEIVERYGSEKSVIVEVHARRESSSEDDAETEYVSVNGDPTTTTTTVSSSHTPAVANLNTETVDTVANDCDENLNSQRGFPAPTLTLFDSLEAGQINLVSESVATVSDGVANSDVFFPDSLECGSNSDKSNKSDSVNSICTASVNNTGVTIQNDFMISETSVPSEMKVNSDVIRSVEISNHEHQLSDGNYADTTLIQLDNMNLIHIDECECKEFNDNKLSVSSRTIDLLTGDDVRSDSSPGGTNGEISSTSSPCSSQDPFGYSVLVDEDENISIKEDLIQLNLDVASTSVSRANENAAENLMVVDVGEQFDINKSISATPKADETRNLTVEAILAFDVKSESSFEGVTDLLCSPVVEFDQSSSSHRQSISFPEKLSPVEESKRKFESEIGRDILRERKMKLELEKIQLEQHRCDNVVEISSPVKNSASLDSKAADVNEDFENVQLRSASFSNGVDELQRTSEPLTKPEICFNFNENKRFSEPNFKVSRPERKASVKELMSKFESKPARESMTLNKDVLSDAKSSEVGTKVVPDHVNNENMTQETPRLIFEEKDTNNIIIEAKVTKGSSRSQENLDIDKQSLCNVQSPTDDNSLMTVSLEGGLDKQLYDQARRERIDKYKEERRAQLRERIRSESFREQDSASEYLLRLKQKTGGANNNNKSASTEKCDDSCGLPVSPRRRARLSAVGFVHSTDDCKPETYVSRRRSFNARCNLPSSCNDVQLSNERSRMRDQAKNKASVSVEHNQDINSHHLSHDSLIRPASIDCSNAKVISTKLKIETSDNTKTNRKEGPATHHVKSPMKERSNNVPVSPTITETSVDSGIKKESKLHYADQDSENPFSLAMNSRGKTTKTITPTPPPRKIKDVAALFEPERQHKMLQDHSKEAQGDDGVRPYSRSFSSTHVPVKSKILTPTKDIDASTFLSSSSASSANKFKAVKKSPS